MKARFLALVSLLVFAVPLPAAAGTVNSGFGAPFSGRAPAALGGEVYSDFEDPSQDELGAALFDIEPAAGALQPAGEVTPQVKKRAKKFRPNSRIYRAPRITGNSHNFVRKRSGE